MIFSLIIGFVLGAAAIIFAIQNTDVVALRFLGWEFESSLALLVIIALAIGAAITLLVSIPAMIGDSFRISRLERHNRKLGETIAEQARAQTVTETTYVVEEVPPQVLDTRRT